MMQVIGVLLGVNIQNAESGAEFQDDGKDEEVSSTSKSETPAERPRSMPTPDPVPEPAPKPMEVETEDVEEKERKARKAEALKEKEAGNAEYKKKNFEVAVEHYSKAVELDGEDISFVTNRAAVYMEMGKFEDCIADCELAVETGRSVHADYKLIAKALTRKGTALMKLAKTSKDYEAAIEVFNKALTEHRNPDTLKKLNDAERVKKELEQQEYFDPTIADTEREKDTILREFSS
jgi:stress-induced-phosphoprotein 1